MKGEMSERNREGEREVVWIPNAEFLTLLSGRS